MGYRLEEVPVEWEDREGTKVNLLRDTVISMIGLLRIGMNDLAGRYRCPQEIDFSTEVWNAGFGAVAQGGSGVASRSTS
jgi:hypothetical protein